MSEKIQGNNPEKSEFAKLEEAVLKFWEENKIFEKTLNKPAPEGEFIFYEGPPTANGRPGIHHLEARAFKDVIPRFKTMQGYHVRRRAGWDTHGLPVELEVEKELKLSSKKEIEQYGIEAFNKKCKESVLKYLELWQNFTKRIGFWVDQNNAYFTFDPKFMESVWWVIKTADDKKLLYKDYKILPWCSRCGTALSSHELAQGYKDVKDLALTVKFKIISQENTFVLAWTTTPWTLPGNVALAVGSDIDYVKIKIGEEFLILAKERLSIISGEYEIIENLKGKDLVGLEYEPLYPFVKGEKAFKIYPADFVTTTDGTGVVHTAVMYGADAFALGTKIGLPKYHIVSDDGTFKPEAGFLAGKFVKDEATAVLIIKDLAGRNLLYKKEKYEHSYPHCWRCKTPLIYFARDSWYIRMSELRDKLVAENKNINWVPEHIKTGRFGEWLTEVKDWAISRERYWGTPLPIWQCKECKENIVVGGTLEIKKRVKKSGNKYFVMRHGQAENNVLRIVSSKITHEHHLTEHGRELAKTAAENLKDKNIDLIFASPYLRTKETAEIIAKETGCEVVFDDRIREINLGKFDLKSIDEYRDFFGYTNTCSADEYFCAQLDKMTKSPPEGESLYDVRQRTMTFLSEIEEKYEGKNILIVTHEYPAWMLLAGSLGLNKEDSARLKPPARDFIEPAVVVELPFVPFPHNRDFELDLHRPYIDDVVFKCDCGGEAHRLPEVLDVWFDSGSMPFAQDHYPFENKEWLDNKGYPADFISEAIDQTRGWFYTLHAVGTIVGKGRAYKNVISLGHILDVEGKKMSKSLGNVVDPNIEIEKYGADLLRFFMYAVNQPGESKNYDERIVSEIAKKPFTLLSNVLTFYETYKKAKGPKIDNVLDRWIIARLNFLTRLVTRELNDYHIFESARAIRDFIFDMSQWYLRRSRERIKSGESETLRFVLSEFSKLIAPFTPFIAEDVYRRVGGSNESVHLEAWPEEKIIDEDVLEKMKETREVVTTALELRSTAGIKVRQPLQKLTINIQLPKEFLEIIALEVNVKEVIIGKELNLDTKITAELKEEGILRDLTRSFQEFRKENNLEPLEEIALFIQTNKSGQDFINKFSTELKKSVLIKEIAFQDNEGLEIILPDLKFKIAIEK